MNLTNLPNDDAAATRGARQIRTRAEAEARRRGIPAIPAPSHADALSLVHELQVHQIELEMQNEDLREAQAGLQTAHDRYLDLYELSPFGYLTLAEDGRIEEANLSAAGLFGIARDELIERPFASLLAAQEDERWVTFFKALIAGGGRQTAVFSVARGGGEVAYFRVHCLGVRRHPLGQSIHVALTDITASKRAGDALREQARFFRLLIENINGFVAVLDVDGRRHYNSPSYERLLKAPVPPGSDSLAEVHAEDRARVAQAFRDTVDSGVGSHLEYRYVLADGSVQLIESRSGVIHDAQGRAKRVVVVSHDITARKAAEAEIHRLAFYDALTRLPNRLTLNDRLQRAMAASRRSRRYGAVMFLDLDHFKQLNDTYGHAAGDRLLVQSARRLTRCVREIDTVARFGRDEFVVVLTELDEGAAPARSSAEAVAEKIRAAIAAPFRLAVNPGEAAATTIEHRCTASIGIVLFLDHDASAADLIKSADIAMYAAKNAGRNQIHVHAAAAPLAERAPAA